MSSVAVRSSPDCVLNDVHSQLNRTEVAEALRPVSVEAAASLLRQCARERRPLIPMGARHAMGGQQFLSGGVVLDTGGLDRILAFDPERGLIVAEAGVRWPALLAWLQRHPANARGWTLRQKQTGSDDFSLGGSIAANIHGRVLGAGPLVDDIEWLDIVGADGVLLRVDRVTEPARFADVVGGYGLCGLVTRACLRLVAGRTLRREVSLVRAGELMARFDEAIARGCEYGDFQFAVDPEGADFLDLGILSCYRPVDERPTPGLRELGRAGFERLLLLAHVDKARAFDEYARHYLGTNGQCYPAAAQHTGIDIAGYHAAIDRALGHRGSEMITELYLPRANFAKFMCAAARVLRDERANPVYGTVRLIERDGTTTLAWARERWACVVFNLHVEHRGNGPLEAAGTFRALIDCALAEGGSYYLTYHRWARPDQIEAAYPRLREFAGRKQACDPLGLFQSDWWRHLMRCL